MSSLVILQFHIQLSDCNHNFVDLQYIVAVLGIAVVISHFFSMLIIVKQFNTTILLTVHTLHGRSDIAHT